MSSYFKDKVAVVLGASAQGGIGWSIAEAFAREGMKLVVGARSFAPLSKLAEKIGGTAFRCDAGEEADIAALADKAMKTYGRIDVAVQSAGLPVQTMIADVSLQNLMDAARVNWFSNVFFVKHMAAAIGSNGSIIIVSSLASTHPIAPMFTYAGAKAATDSMIRYAAFEYGSRQIRINSIVPGPVLTELGTEHHSTPGVPEAYNRNIPLDRMGTGEDMANAALWLAGPSYITGAQLPINGGLHLSRFPYPDEFPGGLKSFGAVQPLFDRQRLEEQASQN